MLGQGQDERCLYKRKANLDINRRLQSSVDYHIPPFKYSTLTIFTIMFAQTFVSMLLAASALAAPSKRAAEPDLSVELTNTRLAITEFYNASTDGTPVLVGSTTLFDLATISCLEVCIPEYHCTVYDKTLTNAVATLNPGATAIASTQVGQIICGSGLAADQRDQGTGVAAPGPAGGAV